MTTQHLKSTNHTAHADRNSGEAALRLVAWETTRNCNLACVHCRASATTGPYTGELDTAEAFRLLDQIGEIAKPIIILTGGEPLLRDDIFDIAAYGTQKGFRMVMAPNGTLVTEDIANKLVDAGIKRISISLDGATAQSHDNFRKVDGAFEGAVNAMKIAKKVGLDFQVNTTITKTNLDQIPKIQQLAVERGAVAHHIFLLVPTGRGKYIVDTEISAAEYEQTLNWFYDQKDKTPLDLKATCAPHYYRILRQRAKKEGKSISFKTHGLDAVTRGCLGGIGFCFISHRGDVQPCGFLTADCGNVRQRSFADIWRHSKVFTELRDYDRLQGKCGPCEFNRVCGGCRARAFEATGDYLAEEPLCSYIPRKARK
ncbi:MAG: heme b synthase [Desulfobacterales bacterium]|jgi:heme b synthase